MPAIRTVKVRQLTSAFGTSKCCRNPSTVVYFFDVPFVRFSCWRQRVQFGCPVFVFLTFQMSCQGMWTGEIHRKSHQFYCQGDFSCISLTEKFLTSYPFRWAIQLEMASVTPWKCMGWVHSGYWAGIAFYFQSINQSINFIYPRIYSVALKC